MVHLLPCTLPRTCSVPGGIRSLSPLPVLQPEEDLDATPCGLSGIAVGPGVRIDKVDAVVGCV